MDIGCPRQSSDAMCSATPVPSSGRIPKPLCHAEVVRPLGLTVKKNKRFLVESVVTRQMQ